jgi:hypothetical protein
MVHFWFLNLVDVYEVARGFPVSADPNDMAFLMPRLEEAAHTVLAIVPLEAILRGPSPDHEGSCERREINQHVSSGRIARCYPQNNLMFLVVNSKFVCLLFLYRP